MYREALMSGVPLKPYNWMLENEKRDFSPTPELISAYNDYVAAETAPGSTDEVLSKRMDRYRFYRFRKLKTYVDEALAKGAPAEDVRYLQITNDHFATQCRELQRKHFNARREADRARDVAYARWYSGDRGKKFEPPPPAKDIVKRDVIKEDGELWQAMHRAGETPPALVKLFDLYLNDSLAGFAQDGFDEFKFNGRGLMRNRDVYDKGGS